MIVFAGKFNRIELRREGIDESSGRNRRSESEIGIGETKKKGKRDSDLIRRECCVVNFGEELNATALFFLSSTLRRFYNFYDFYVSD